MTGSRCLDAFAGSGALGFEAISRGARQVVMLERNAAVVRQLRANAALLLLDIEQIDIVHTDALLWLSNANADPFDIVFLDPPFADALLPNVLEALRQHNWLTDSARIYVETAAHQTLPAPPPEWQWLREKTAGQVRFGLVMAERESSR